MFTEDWYPPRQLQRVAALAQSVAAVPGHCIEVGVWEGRSAIAIARAIAPRPLLAVDTWAGNVEESQVTGQEHPSVTAARERDVFAAFQANVQAAGVTTIRPFRMSWQDFVIALTGPVAFLHLDASHDYASVRDSLAAFIPRLSRGAVICGDDFQSASAQRDDLQGGVERAVREAFGPALRSAENLWWVPIQ